MACGRPKNLEIAARNLLCGSRDRRRNFFTTRDGNRRRGNRATRQRTTPGLRARRSPAPRRGGNSAPPVRGKPRTTRYWADSGASGPGESPVPAARGTPARVKPEPPGSGKTSRHAAEGKPRVVRGEESLGPPAKGKLQGTYRRGNHELCAEKKA